MKWRKSPDLRGGTARLQPDPSSHLKKSLSPLVEPAVRIDTPLFRNRTKATLGEVKPETISTSPSGRSTEINLQCVWTVEIAPQ
jgi:hypothetical protein